MDVTDDWTGIIPAKRKIKGKENTLY